MLLESFSLATVTYNALTSKFQFILQLINGIPYDLQKFLRYFNGMATDAFFGIALV